MYLVTGATGFIGSNILADMLDAGFGPVAIHDNMGSELKWRNIAKHQFSEFIPMGQLENWLVGRKLQGVIHMAANSSTTARDGDEVMASNYNLSIMLLDWCTQNKVPFIYASSAATYGDGELGFVDDESPEFLTRLRPLNLYGFSKNAFDREVTRRKQAKEKLPPQIVGLKFFNVYGPNEFHKAEMMSLVAKRFAPIMAGERIQLFKSHKDGFADGEQLRDFVYVRDVTKAILWFVKNTRTSGLFNIGTGKAQSFRELMTATFTACNKPVQIDYVPMPESIRNQYQYYTQADLTKLRGVGCDVVFSDVQAGVTDYVQSYLSQADQYR